MLLKLEEMIFDINIFRNIWQIYRFTNDECDVVIAEMSL